MSEENRELSEYMPGSVLIPAENLGQIITEMMRPVMQTIGKLLENNTAAMEQLSAAQSVQNDRLEALEKQIRLQTKVDGKQVSYLNDAIRHKARELLDKRGIEDGKAITKLGNAIRKAVLKRYGVSTLRDVPKHEYNVALNQIDMWSDLLTVRDVAKEARSRAETPEHAEPPAGEDGAEALSREAH